MCGLATKFQQCAGCGEGDIESASYLSGGNAKACHLRNCTFCGRRAGAEKTKNLLYLWQDLPRNKDYRLKHITVQVAWDPNSAEDTSTEAYRERAFAGWDAIRAAYNPERYLKLPKDHPLQEHALLQEGCALYAKLEASQNGFVHFHLLYYGPFLRWYCTKETCKNHCRCQRSGQKPAKRFYIEDLMKRAYHKMGRVWLTEVPEGQEDKAVQEVCKYVSKGPSPLDEKAILGAKRWRLNPTLAARLELALHGVHCNEVYAGFRKKAAPKGSKQELDEYLSNLSFGALDLLDKYLGGTFATYEDFLEWAKGIQISPEILEELHQAVGFPEYQVLVGELAELLDVKAKAEAWLDNERCCKACGVKGEWAWQSMSTYDFIKMKQKLYKPPEGTRAEIEERLKELFPKLAADPTAKIEAQQSTAEKLAYWEERFLYG